MNNYRSIIWRFFTVFFFIFGLLQTLFFARAIFPQFRASGLNTPQTLLCMVSAIILSALYSMICVDGQESLYAIKSRLIICGIPCVLICSVLSVNYGLPSLILDLLGIADRGTGISIWLIAVILSSAVLILALYLLERHYPRSVPHVHKHPRAGYQNDKLCRCWVLAGCTPEGRRKPAGQRCAYARRCPEASRPRWAA